MDTVGESARSRINDSDRGVRAAACPHLSRRINSVEDSVSIQINGDDTVYVEDWAYGDHPIAGIVPADTMMTAEFIGREVDGDPGWELSDDSKKVCWTFNFEVPLADQGPESCAGEDSGASISTYDVPGSAGVLDGESEHRGGGARLKPLNAELCVSAPEG